MRRILTVDFSPQPGHCENYADSGDGGIAVTLQRAVDVGDGGDDGGDRAADRVVRGDGPPHGPLHRGDGAEISLLPRRFPHVAVAVAASTWPCFWSPRCCWAGPAEPAGRTVVTVRLWDEQVAAAYRESFAEFSREHPDIEVRINVVAYAHPLRQACGPTWQAAAPTTSSGCQTPTSPATPTVDAGQRRRERWAPNASSGMGARSGQPVHPQRCVVGGAAADRRRNRSCISTPTFSMPRVWNCANCFLPALVTRPATTRCGQCLPG